MRAYTRDPMKTVSLEKVTDYSGDLPLGAIYNWTYKSALMPDAALARARAALLRDHPDEKPINWKLVEA
jgi:hypothetical protein